MLNNSMMPSSSSPSPSHIKGYLTVRLKLPHSEDNYDETFFFVREHKGKTSPSEESSSSKPGCTLFVANVPVVPGVATKILLKSLFGRYADLGRVTVVDNPREVTTSAVSQEGYSWSSKARHPTFLPPIHSQGRFAHIVFESPKGMKKTLRALENVMRNKGNNTDTSELPGLVLERIEIQTLSDETNRQYRESLRKFKREISNDDSDDEDEDSADEQEMETKTGILAVAERYRASCNFMSRAELLEECNAVMQAYEDAEEEKKRAQEAAKSQPDDDGFVTVSYSSAVGSKTELEESITATTPNRRKGNKRSRKKKESVGKTELQDFYRFQRRENRKRTLEDLRRQFEADLKKVKRLKEDRQYRPF